MTSAPTLGSLPLFLSFYKTKMKRKTKLEAASCPLMVKRRQATYRQAISLLDKDKQQGRGRNCLVLIGLPWMEPENLHVQKEWMKRESSCLSAHLKHMWNTHTLGSHNRPDPDSVSLRPLEAIPGSDALCQTWRQLERTTGEGGGERL